MTVQVLLELKSAMMKQMYDKDLHKNVYVAELRRQLCTDIAAVKAKESGWTS